MENNISSQSDNTVTYYCSGTAASSTEDGSINNPFKTLLKAIQSIPDGSTLLLERGYEYPFFTDIFYRSLNLGAYGEGEKPVISRFIKIRNTNKDLFTRDNPNLHIWTINFNRLMAYSGHDASDLANIGFIYNPADDLIVFGEKVAFTNAVDMYVAFNYHDPDQSQIQAFTCLNKNGSFYQSSDGKTIKIIYPGDPNDIRELWLAPTGQFITSPTNCTISDIKITGFGSNAIYLSRDNVTVRNVDFDLIGGGTLDPSKVETTSFKRYGNGLEIWKHTDTPTPISDIEITQCHFNRIFDNAVSIIGYVRREQGDIGARNISINNCRITNCRSSIHSSIYFLEEDGSITGGVPVENVEFSNNQSYNAGMNGFNSPEPRDAHLSGGLPGFKISGSTFYNGNYRFQYTYAFGFDMQPDNVCHLYPDQALITVSTSQVTEILYPDDPTGAEVAEVIAEYRALTGDEYTTFIGIENKQS